MTADVNGWGNVRLEQWYVVFIGFESFGVACLYSLAIRAVYNTGFIDEVLL